MSSLRVLILYNDDEGLAYGESHDSLATLGVLDEVNGVEEACRTLGYEPVRAAAPHEAAELLALLSRSGARVIFNLVEALRGEVRLEAAVAWLYELARVPYTGSPPLALSLALQKPLTNAALRGMGIPVPAGRLLERGDESLEGLQPPLIVKPAREDASHGISLESVTPDLEAAGARARYVIETYRQPALVEEFIDGREFNISVIGEGETARALSLAEIDYTDFPAGAPRLITYRGKWALDHPECTGSKPVAAKDLTPELAARIEEVALAAFRAIGLRDYGRIDIRLHPTLGPVVLDVNANPDISPTAGLAKAAGRTGIAYPELIRGIIEGALARCPRA